MIGAGVTLGCRCGPTRHGARWDSRPAGVWNSTNLHRLKEVTSMREQIDTYVEDTLIEIEWDAMVEQNR
jgi:hypothetical protein